MSGYKDKIRMVIASNKITHATKFYFYLGDDCSDVLQEGEELLQVLPLDMIASNDSFECLWMSLKMIDNLTGGKVVQGFISNIFAQGYIAGTKVARREQKGKN